MTQRILLALFFCGYSYANQPSHMTLHVFVHGSTFSGQTPQAAVASLIKKWDEAQITATKNARKETALFDMQPMLEEGLVNVSDLALQNCRANKLPSQLSRRAAPHIINAYDTFIQPRGITNRYYTFGWSGITDEGYAKREAKGLYNQLVHERERIHRWYPDSTISIILHGHSHGGQLITHLADCEEDLKKKLEIACTVLYGCPIQMETIQYLKHQLFKTVINIFSENDPIQVADLGMSSDQSYHAISEMYTWKNTSEKYMVDITISLNNTHNVFSHASFFYLDAACYKSTLFELIRPLPLVAFAPIIIDLVQRASTKPTYAHLNIISDSTCYFELSARNMHRRIMSHNIAPQLTPIKELLELSWRPFIACDNRLQAGIRTVRRTITRAPQNIFENYIKPWFD